MVKTLTPGRLAWREMRILAGVELYLSATFFTSSFCNKGELSDPRGE